MMDDEGGRIRRRQEIHPEPRLHPRRLPRVARNAWRSSGPTRRTRKSPFPCAPENVYMTPTGYKIHIEKHPGRSVRERIIGTAADGHLPAISPAPSPAAASRAPPRRLRDYMLYGPIFVADIHKDLDRVDAIIDKRLRQPLEKLEAAHARAAVKRALHGSCFPRNARWAPSSNSLPPIPTIPTNSTPGSKSIPSHIYAIVFIIKRFYKPEWGEHLKASTSTSTSSTGASGQRTQDRRTQTRRHLPVRRPAEKRRLADLQTPAGFRRRTKNPNRRRHHRLRRRPRHRGRFPHQNLCRLLRSRASPTSSPSTANTAFSSWPDDAIHRGLDEQTEHRPRPAGQLHLQLRARCVAEQRQVDRRPRCRLPVRKIHCADAGDFLTAKPRRGSGRRRCPNAPGLCGRLRPPADRGWQAVEKIRATFRRARISLDPFSTYLCQQSMRLARRDARQSSRAQSR